MIIKVLTDFRHAGLTYQAGKLFCVSEPEAATFCAAGWAEDITGSIPTGPLNPGHVTLDVHSPRHANSTEF